MRPLRSLQLLMLLLFVLPGGLASAQDQNKEEIKPVKASKAVKPAAKAEPKLTQEQKLGYQLLENSNSAARGLEAPMRSYSLFQIASAYNSSDEKKTRALLADAFRASLEIQDNDNDKSRLQEEIFRALLPLSLDDVLELLPQTEPSVRKETSGRIISQYTDKKQFEKAIAMVNDVTAWDEFPYDSGGRLLDALPADMMAEKLSLFTQAVNSYKNHKHEGMRFGGSLTNMLVRNGHSMPPKLVLDAIDDILSQAKSTDQQRNIRIGGSGGSVNFSSNFEYQLFAVLPILHALDESKAQSLLEENQSLKAKLEQFPDGLQSISPPRKEGDNHLAGPPLSDMSVWVGNGPPGTGGPAGMEDTRRRVSQITEEGATDAIQAIAHAMTLPTAAESFRLSPRAQALEGIARANIKKNPGAAAQALSELRKSVADAPPRQQARHLRSAADLYMDLGDQESAEKVVSEGFKAADKLLEIDLNPDDPNKALKAWWPSTDAYRMFVEVETKISQRGTMAVLKEIKDPEIRTLESIMFARSLLGQPIKRSIVIERRKGTDWTSVSEN